MLLTGTLDRTARWSLALVPGTAFNHHYDASPWHSSAETVTVISKSKGIL